MLKKMMLTTATLAVTISSVVSLAGEQKVTVLRDEAAKQLAIAIAPVGKTSDSGLSTRTITLSTSTADIKCTISDFSDVIKFMDKMRDDEAKKKKHYEKHVYSTLDPISYKCIISLSAQGQKVEPAEGIRNLEELQKIF